MQENLGYDILQLDLKSILFPKVKQNNCYILCALSDAYKLFESSVQIIRPHKQNEPELKNRIVSHKNDRKLKNTFKLVLKKIDFYLWYVFKNDNFASELNFVS